MLASGKTMKEFIKDDQGSWVMVFVVALMMLFTLMRVLGGEAPKGRGADMPGELQTAGFVKSEPRVCASAIAVSIDVERRNEVQTALGNVVAAFRVLSDQIEPFCRGGFAPVMAQNHLGP